MFSGEKEIEFFSNVLLLIAVILAYVHSKGFKISVATIYNNLNHFVEAGLLKKRQVDNNRSYFDNNVSDHFHLFDEETNTLTDIPPSSVKFAKLPKLPKNKQIKNINLVINIKKNPV